MSVYNCILNNEFTNEGATHLVQLIASVSAACANDVRVGVGAVLLSITA